MLCKGNAAVPTILCIDDHQSGLIIRKKMLESQGYSVLTAADGLSGLSVLARCPVDAVVLDYRMPGMNGDAVAQTIRKEHPDLPVVLLTGYPQDPSDTNLVGLVDAVITKGEPPQSLLGALERLLETKPDKLAARISRDIEGARKLQEQAKAIHSETLSKAELNQGKKTLSAKDIG